MINLIKKLKCGKVLENVPLEKYTTYGLKGRAKMIVFPENIAQLIKLLKQIKNNNLKHKIIGSGANLIFEEEYYDGILIHLDFLDELKITDSKIEVGAGYNLVRLALKVSRLGYTGMEFATGIPGTVGGAIVNNAGAYKSDMGYIVKSVTAISPDYEIVTFNNKDVNFHYRTSFFKENPEYIIISTIITLKQADKKEIMDTIEDRRNRRRIGQPLEYPSAGSVFRNPPDNFAGKLIEDIGYKGKKIGGAEVSLKHANFIVNTGGATGKDVVTLINEIKTNVKEKYNIDLILEQEIVK